MSEENNANFLPFIKKIFSSMKRQTDSSKTQQIAIFSDDEMDQLHNSFILTLQDLTLIVDCCCFILEQVLTVILICLQCSVCWLLINVQHMHMCYFIFI